MSLKSTKLPMLYQGSKKYPVNEVVIHCSATKPSWMANSSLASQRNEIRRWHMVDNKWKDIGYHMLGGRNGSMLGGRDYTVIGAGVMGHNNGVLHYCLIGGWGAKETDEFLTHFTPEQESTLLQWLASLRTKTQITKVTGHNDWAPKACPGFNVAKWLNRHGGLAKVLSR